MESRCLERTRGQRVHGKQVPGEDKSAQEAGAWRGQEDKGAWEVVKSVMRTTTLKDKIGTDHTHYRPSVVKITHYKSHSTKYTLYRTHTVQTTHCTDHTLYRTHTVQTTHRSILS